jgi:hypothetical protein
VNNYRSQFNRILAGSTYDDEAGDHNLILDLQEGI